MTLNNKPQGDVVRFVKELKKILRHEAANISGDGQGDQLSAKTLVGDPAEHPRSIADMKVLDAGSGTGRNAYYLSELGAEVTGIEISDTAIEIAKQRAAEARLNITYLKQDMAKDLPFENESLDLILDVTSSNSLGEEGRAHFLRESARVLRRGGFIFLKTLCKDGDENAKYLLKHSPGKGYDTYYMKELDLYERVFSREDLIALYEGAGFTLVSLNKKTSYPKVGDRVYKRNSWIAVWRKM